MNDNCVKCFLCLEKANNHRIVICKSCILALVVQQADTCLKSPLSEESHADGKLINFESLTEEMRGGKDIEDASYCHYENNKDTVDIIDENGDLTNDAQEVELLHNNYEKTEDGKNSDVKHNNHQLCHPGDLRIYNMLGHNITKLMEEFYHVSTNFNKKIHDLGFSIEHNNREIEEIKETIEATTLQLKTLINDHERTFLSCLDKHVTRQMTKQKTDLQTALEEVNKSIEITREMLKEHDELEQHCVLKEDDDSGICDDHNDTSLKRTSMVMMDDDITPPKAIIPDSIRHVLSLGNTEELNDPVGVTTSTDGSTIFITDYSNDRIQVFDSATGQLIRTLNHVTTDTGRQTTFLCPSGLATNYKTGDIVLAERGRHRITIMTCDGILKHKFGKMGKAHSQLRNPHGVSVDRRGRIIVADTANSRIQVYDKEGDFIFTFGHKGDEKLDYPSYALFHKGLFIVSDTDNDSVKVYDKDGHYLRRLSDDPEGVFSAPSGLAIYQDDYILVCDYNNDSVKMFSQQGKFILKFGSAGSGPGQFCGPEAVTVSCDCKIVVTDKNNSRVQIFE